MTSQRPAKCPPVSVIICTLNEAQNLPHVLPKIPDWVDEIMLVDGHSTDDTIAVAKKIMPHIKIVVQPGRGKGDAMRYGILKAKGEIIVMLDADGSTDASQITDFILPLTKGYDFVKGSRFLNKQLVMPPIRKLGNKFFAVLTNLLYGTSYTDVCAGMNVFWKKVIPVLDPNGKSFLDEPTLNIRLKKRGFKVMEVSQIDTGRIHGEANEHFVTQGWRILRIIISERFRA